MADQANNNKPLDPLEPWRGMRDVYLNAWAKSMVDMVNTEAYAQATGAMLDTYLTVSAPFREAVEKAMLKTLEQLAMPSRADVVSLAERMTNIEMRLDDMDAKLDALYKFATNVNPLSSTNAVAAPRKAPPRAKKANPRKPARRGKS